MAAKGPQTSEDLTDEQIAREEEFLKGIPRVNIGALFLPPIWGPAHGIWPTILFYPMWLFADNMLYAAFAERTPLSLVLAAVVFVMLLGLTVAFSILAQPYAAHRAAGRGQGKQEYLHRERIWAAACVAAGLVMVAAATYYNLVIRPGAGA